MCKYFKKVWNDPVISQLIFTGIISGLGYLFTWLSNISLESIWANYSQAIITSAVFITILWVYVLIYRIKSKKTPFLKEKETLKKICGFHWKWQWKYIAEKNKYQIFDLKPICEICGEVLILIPYSSFYECHNNHQIKSENVNFILAYDAIYRMIKEKYPKYSDKIIY